MERIDQVAIRRHILETIERDRTTLRVPTKYEVVRSDVMVRACCDLALESVDEVPVRRDVLEAIEARGAALKAASRNKVRRTKAVIGTEGVD